MHEFGDAAFAAGAGDVDVAHCCLGVAQAVEKLLQTHKRRTQRRRVVVLPRSFKILECEQTGDGVVVTRELHSSRTLPPTTPLQAVPYRT